jgi:hypothetical protein
MRAPTPCGLGIAFALWLVAAPAVATVDPFANAPPAQPPRGPAVQDPPRAEPADAERPGTATPPRTGSPDTPEEPAGAATTATTAPAPTPAGPGPGAAVRECALSLDAAPLLREADSRGIQPRMTAGAACDASPADNRFFGGGGSSACKLRFDNASWLRQGARFTSVTGVGTFDAPRVSPTGVEVSIPPQGGVRFRRIGVLVTVPAGAGCPAPRPGNVLAQ